MASRGNFGVTILTKSAWLLPQCADAVRSNITPRAACSEGGQDAKNGIPNIPTNEKKKVKNPANTKGGITG
jgi:hypothetical protein